MDDQRFEQLQNRKQQRYRKTYCGAEIERCSVGFSMRLRANHVKNP